MSATQNVEKVHLLKQFKEQITQLQREFEGLRVFASIARVSLPWLLVIMIVCVLSLITLSFNHSLSGKSSDLEDTLRKLIDEKMVELLRKIPREPTATATTTTTTVATPSVSQEQLDQLEKMQQQLQKELDALQLLVKAQQSAQEQDQKLQEQARDAEKQQLTSSYNELKVLLKALEGKQSDLQSALDKQRAESSKEADAETLMLVQKFQASVDQLKGDFAKVSCSRQCAVACC